MVSKSLAKTYKKNFRGAVYILPWLLGFLLLQLYPFAVSLYYSFTDTAISGNGNWTGLSNYIQLFTKDKDFKASMVVTFKYVCYAVPGKIIMALIVAVILNMNIRFIKLYRTVFYLPSILGGSVAISALWRVMFAKSGVINAIVTGIFGTSAINWLGDPKYALFTISVIEMWQFGSSMVIFLAALKQVPQELYEAARIDGARKIKMFFKITLPMISSLILFNVVMQTINALQNFTSAFVVTKGGPVKSTYLMGLKLYEDAFSLFKMGYACAQSWILFGAIMVFTIIIFVSSKYWVYYDN